jgi:hypothetical protein
VVLYMMLTGLPPFDGDEMYAQVLPTLFAPVLHALYILLTQAFPYMLMGVPPLHGGRHARPGTRFTPSSPRFITGTGPPSGFTPESRPSYTRSAPTLHHNPDSHLLFTGPSLGFPSITPEFHRADA